VVTAVILVILPVFGQAITGRMVGIVTDPTGAVIQNATVTATNKATNSVRTVLTDNEGRYIITNLEPGVYKVTASATGFKTAVVDDVVIRVATEEALDLELQAGGFSETILVTDVPSVVESKTSDIGNVIAGRLVRELPLNGRDFAQLTRLVAGATSDSEGGIAPFVVNGQRASANSFLVDGTEVNDPLMQVNGLGASGTSMAYASVEAIQEFKVQTTNFSAEFGRCSGAVVNVITRSGTNEFHGSLFEFLRNDRLDANNFFNNAAGVKKPPLRSNQFGGIGAGPILKERLFFFSSYEGLRQQFGAISNGTVPSLLARQIADERIKPVINQIVLPTGPPIKENPLLATFTGIAPSRVREDNVSMRLDARFSDSDVLFVRYAGSDGRRNFGGSSVGDAPNVCEDGPSRLQNVAIGYTHVFSAALVNEFRIGFNRIHNEAMMVAKPLFGAVPAPVKNGIPLLPLVIVSDETLNSNVVGGTIGPAGNSFNTFQYIDHVSYIHGRHSVKIGGDIRRVQINSFNEGANGGEGGIIVFATTEDLVANFPQAFVNQVGIRRRGFRLTNYGFYAQEDFHTTRGLTWNLGLRYELNTTLREVNGLQSNVTMGPDGLLRLTPTGSSLYQGDHNNLAPRVGFAYSPLRHHRLAVRGGFGVYYDQLNQMATNLMSNPPVTLTNMAFLPGPYPDFLPFLPTQPATEPPFGGATMIPLNIRTPYTYQYNFNVQYEPSPGMRVQSAYVGSRGIKLLRERIINFLLPFGPLPGPVTSFSDPNFGIIEINEASSQSVYNGLQLTIEQWFSRNLGMLASYTWSHSIDDASTLGLFGTSILGARSASPFPSNPNNVRAERGNSNFDVRHVLSLSFSWEPPLKRVLKSPGFLVEGWTLTGILTARTGQPLTVTVGSDAAGIGDATPFFSQRPNRVPGVPLTLGKRKGPDLRLNPAAYSVPPIGTFGNLGRNTVRGPSFSQCDFALFKAIRVAEKFRVQVRIESFNLFNRANFSLPSETTNLRVALNSPQQFGVSTSTVNTQNLNVGAVFAPGGPRNIQIGLKIIY